MPRTLKERLVSLVGRAMCAIIIVAAVVIIRPEMKPPAAWAITVTAALVILRLAGREFIEVVKLGLDAWKEVKKK